MDEQIKINMFGRLLISHNGKELSDSKIKTNQLITLLTYIIYHRGKHLFLDNLYGVLWPEDNSDNPAHALRNLIYRARNVLKQTLEPDIKYILTLENNSYCWNKDITTVCDTNQFDEYINAGDNKNSNKDQRISSYLKADELYSGDFLAGLSGQDWVIPIATYFRHKYETAMRNLAQLLMDEKRYDEALEISVKATDIDNFDEKSHQNIIDIYSRHGQNDLAVKHYQYISNLFYKELGASLSDETVDLYKRAAAADTANVDIRTIKLNLSEDEDFGIPLFCDYRSLKYLFSLQIRNLERRDDSQFLLLLTLTTKAGKPVPKTTLQKDMGNVIEVLKKCLRCNDVAASYSESQFILMLSSLSYENAEMIKGRIEKDYARYSTGTKITFSIVAIY